MLLKRCTVTLSTSVVALSEQGGPVEETLQGLVGELFGQPTLEGVDDLLDELRDRRSDPAVAGLIDDLLDHRLALSHAVEAVPAA